MVVGVGVGDIIKLTECAWRLYKGYKDSSADFAQLTAELQGLYVILTEISDFLRSEKGEDDDYDDDDECNNNDAGDRDHHGDGSSSSIDGNSNHYQQLDASRRNRLSILHDTCWGVLRDMEALYTRYDSLGTQQQRTWDRLRLGLKDLSELKGRLVSCTTLLTAWNVAVINSSTSRINKKLDKFIAEVRAGLREGSVVTAPDAAQAIESSPDVWNELRRELEDVGINAAVVEEKRDYILAWFQQQLADGGLDETCDAAIDQLASSSSLATIPFTVIGDSGYGGSETCSFGPEGTCGSSTISTIRTSQDLSLGMANRAFEEELKRQRIEWPPDRGQIPPGARELSNASTAAPVAVKRRTTPMGMIRKLFLRDREIIEAASDGQLESVARLIRLGMDVNARDQWGWSALSMCGYGGYKDVARLLLDHGADLDNVDVDGDTPTSLAAQRGHTELVILFDEEREARDLRVREMDQEKPRRVGS